MDNANIHKVKYSAEELSYSIIDTKEFIWEGKRTLLQDFTKLDWAHAHF